MRPSANNNGRAALDEVLQSSCLEPLGLKHLGASRPVLQDQGDESKILASSRAFSRQWYLARLAAH